MEPILRLLSQMMPWLTIGTGKASYQRRILQHAHLICSVMFFPDGYVFGESTDTPGAIHDGWDLASIHVHLSKLLPSFFLSYKNPEGKISEIDNPSKEFLSV
jgi:hypothetical protein